MEETIQNKVVKTFSKEEFSTFLTGMENANEDCLRCYNFLKRKVLLDIDQIRREGIALPILSEKREKFLSKCLSHCLAMVEIASKLADQFDSFNEMLGAHDLW